MFIFETKIMTKAEDLKESAEEAKMLETELSQLHKMESDWMKKTAWQRVRAMAFWLFAAPVLIILYIKGISIVINLLF